MAGDGIYATLFARCSLTVYTPPFIPPSIAAIRHASPGRESGAAQEWSSALVELQPGQCLSSLQSQQYPDTDVDTDSSIVRSRDGPRPHDSLKGTVTAGESRGILFERDVWRPNIRVRTQLSC